MPAMFRACMKVQPQMAGEPTAAAWDVVEAPGETLAAKRSELATFDSLLSAIEAFQAEISSATARLAAAPEALLKQLEHTCGSGAPAMWTGTLVPQLTAQLRKTAEGLHSGERHMQAVQYLLEQSREQSSEVRSAFKARDSAWVPKERCDKRAAELRKRFGPNLMLAEKRARLQQKHQADQEFQRCTADAVKAVNDLLDRRWPLVGAMVWEICRHYMAIFQDAEKLTTGFRGVANTLVPPLPAEAQLVPADSVIASGNPMPGVREWLERARSAGAAREQSCSALQLPPRRRPVAPPPTPSLQRLGATSAAPTQGPGAVDLQRPSVLGGLAGATTTGRWTPPPPPQAPAPFQACPPLFARPASSPTLVRVWNSITQSWVDTVVDRISDRPQAAQGLSAPAGSMTVPSEQIGDVHHRLHSASNCVQN